RDDAHGGRSAAAVAADQPQDLPVVQSPLRGADSTTSGTPTQGSVSPRGNAEAVTTTWRAQTTPRMILATRRPRGGTTPNPKPARTAAIGSSGSVYRRSLFWSSWSRTKGASNAVTIRPCRRQRATTSPAAHRRTARIPN